MNRTILTAFAFFLTVLCGAGDTITFTTLDGIEYKDASIERVCPNGIDIGYRKADGSYAIKFIDYLEMPEDLRTREGIDKAKAQKFSEEVAAVSSKTMNQIAEEREASLKALAAKVKQKLDGGDIEISSDELKAGVYAGRFCGEVTFEALNKGGTIVKVINVTSGKNPDSEFIQIDGCILPDSDKKWTAFFYPTGLKAKYKGKDIPVYSDDPDSATDLLAHYLAVYSTYALAAADDDKNDKKESDSSSVQPPDQAQSVTAPPPAENVTNIYTSNNYYSGGYYGGYYIGGSYWPVYWYNNNYHNWNPPYRPWPPRPHPPRPPRPEPPGPPPRPYPQVPVIGTKPSRPTYPAGQNPSWNNTTVNYPSVIPSTPGGTVKPNVTRPITIVPPKQPQTRPGNSNVSRPQTRPAPAPQTRPAPSPTVNFRPSPSTGVRINTSSPEVRQSFPVRGSGNLRQVAPRR